MLVYPFTSVLDIMKPSKIDSRKKSHQQKLTEIVKSPEYLWEEKLDGISIMSIGGRLYGNGTSIKNGWPIEKTDRMPYVVADLLKAGTKAVFDGEGYVVGKKSNDIASLLNCNVEDSLSKQTSKGWVEYHVYDMLRDVDGTWMINQPFEARRKRLEEVFQDFFKNSSSVILNEIHTTEEDVLTAFEAIVAKGLEGSVLKSKKGLYVPGKRPQWNQVKLKASLEDDVVIMDFNEATKKYSGKDFNNWPYWEEGEPVSEHYFKKLIGSIKVGKYSQGELIEVGNVTGIDDALRVQMTNFPGNFIGRVITIKAMEKTSDSKYRHANFKHFHADKRAEECVIEDIEG